MKKKVMPKNKKVPQPQPITKTTWFLIAIFFLIVLYLIVYIAQGNHLLDRPVARKTREDFAQIEQTVEKVRQDAEAAGLGGLVLQKSCGQFNYKFREGEKYCYVGIEKDLLVSKGTSAQQSVAILEGSIGVNNDNLEIKTPYHVTRGSNDFPESLQPGISGSSYFHNPTRVVCGSVYEIRGTESMNPTTLLRISFSCRAHATDLHYPIP